MTYGHWELIDVGDRELTIEFREELPTTFVGKILRRELMEEERAKQGG